jgi:hypothetical protein
MKKLSCLLQVVLLTGIVDQINGSIANVEITDSSNEVLNTSLPVTIFPCQVKEGEPFYFIYVDGVTEIRCGEPPI